MASASWRSLSETRASIAAFRIEISPSMTIFLTSSGKERIWILSLTCAVGLLTLEAISEVLSPNSRSKRRNFQLFTVPRRADASRTDHHLEEVLADRFEQDVIDHTVAEHRIAEVEQLFLVWLGSAHRIIRVTDVRERNAPKLLRKRHNLTPLFLGCRGSLGNHMERRVTSSSVLYTRLPAFAKLRDGTGKARTVLRKAYRVFAACLA